MSMMRAVVITKPGGPDVLTVENRPIPDPAPSEVLVRVHASALNRADLMQREGHYPPPAGAPVDIPGLEFAGEVARLGDRVTSCRRGDRVFGIVAGGGNAEYLVADAHTLAPIPDNLSWTEAAAIPEAFITAYDALVTQAGVASNDNVLIHAVGSGVGLAAVQLARAWEAIPFGTARSADKIARARECGLEAGVVVANDVDVLHEAIARLTNGNGINVTLDLLGGPYLDASVRAAAMHGRIMLIGSVAGRASNLSIGMVMGKRLALRGTVLRARSIDEKRLVTAAFARDVVPLIASGVLRPMIDSTFDLVDIRSAHERLEANSTFGKVVIRIV